MSFESECKQTNENEVFNFVWRRSFQYSWRSLGQSNIDMTNATYFPLEVNRKTYDFYRLVFVSRRRRCPHVIGMVKPAQLRSRHFFVCVVRGNSNGRWYHFSNRALYWTRWRIKSSLNQLWWCGVDLWVHCNSLNTIAMARSGKPKFSSTLAFSTISDKSKKKPTSRSRDGVQTKMCFSCRNMESYWVRRAFFSSDSTFLYIFCL